MRAIVNLTRDGGTWCTAKTENELAIVLAAADGTAFALGDELDIDFSSVFDTQELSRISDARRIAIRIQPFDVHDLRVPFRGHGVPSNVSAQRMLSD